MMIIEKMQELEGQIDAEVKRAELRLETSVIESSSKRIKEELTFWSDSLKRELHHEVNQLCKEPRQKVAQFEKVFL